VKRKGRVRVSGHAVEKRGGGSGGDGEEERWEG
jgi:hypothetical protein